MKSDRLSSASGGGYALPPNPSALEGDLPEHVAQAPVQANYARAEPRPSRIKQGMRDALAFAGPAVAKATFGVGLSLGKEVLLHKGATKLGSLGHLPVSKGD